MTLQALRIRIHRRGYAIWPWVKDGLAGLALVAALIVAYRLLDFLAAVLHLARGY